MREARLELVDPVDRRVVRIDKNVFEIGRREGTDLQLIDTDVSRSHAQIRREAGRFTLKDQGSLHGTFVNGERTAECVLADGDRLQFGRNRAAEVIFRLEEVQSEPMAEPTTTVSGGDLRQIALLLQKLRALGSGRVLDEVLALVLDSSLDLTGADRGFIMLAGPDRKLEFKLARARGGISLPGRTFETSRKIPEDVFATGKQAIVEDLLDDQFAPLHSGTVALGIRHVLCTPLRLVHYVDEADKHTGDDAIGVLYLDSRTRGKLSMAPVKSALETLGSEAALAIENARLYREALEKTKLEQELKVAAAFQQALLPGRLRTGPFFTAAARSIPCRETGGDFFDYADRSTGDFGFMVGDITGKGAAAALLAAAMVGMFSAEVAHQETASTLMTAINRRLYARSLDARFVTAFYGLLGRNGVLRYSNAGHNPPILLTRSGTRRLDKGGLILGIFAEASFEEDQIALEPGDTVLIFTDGVTEARDRANEEFADERLIATVSSLRGQSPEALVDAVVAAVDRFAGGAEVVDDLTVVAIRYDG